MKRALLHGAVIVSTLGSVGVLGCKPVSAQATYYVAPSGDDTKGDGSQATPWLNMGFAADRMSAGDTCVVRGGQYTFGDSVEIKASGQIGLPLKFVSATGETPTFAHGAGDPLADLDTLVLSGAYIVIDGLTVTNLNGTGQGIWISETAHDITVRSCEIMSVSGEGILVSGHDNLIEKNSVHDNGSPAHHQFDQAIYVEGARNVISKNLVHHNYVNGIQLNDSRRVGGGLPIIETGDNTVTGNYVFHNGFGLGAGAGVDTAGIIVAEQQSGAVVEYNIVSDNAMFGVRVGDGSTTTVTGNVTAGNQMGGVYCLDAGRGTVLTGNVSYDDQGFALCLRLLDPNDVDSNANAFFSTSGQLTFQWERPSGQLLVTHALATFRSATASDGARSGKGDDVSSTDTLDPAFSTLPAWPFDESQASSYDFSTYVIPSLTMP